MALEGPQGIVKALRMEPNDSGEGKAVLDDAWAVPWSSL